jgi:rubrerythrin
MATKRTPTKRTARKAAPTKTASRKPADLGANRTGVQTAPARTRKMVENTSAVPAAPLEANALALARAELSQQAPPIGTMPLPGSLKGMAKTAASALQGEKATVFLDKLGERLAFERTGTRLYEAVLAKLPASRLTEGTLTVEEVRRFRDEELRHMHLVREALETVGGDPTAQTPSADVAGVQALGILQVVTDPRTTLTQCLDAMLTAELADNDGWKILVALAEATDQPELARRFAAALAEEDRHLASVRAWVAERLGIELGRELPSTDFGEPASPQA